MCETGCGERARFRSLQGYDLCRTCYVERRVGEVEPEVLANRARQPNPAALPTREEVEAVLPEGFRAPGGFYRYIQGHMFDIFGSESRALDIIRERVAEVTGRVPVGESEWRDTERAPAQVEEERNIGIGGFDYGKGTWRAYWRGMEIPLASASVEPKLPRDPYATHRLNNTTERHITNPETSDLDQRIAAVRTDADPVEEWSVFESPTWEE